MRKKYGINHIDIGFNCHKNWTSMEGNKTIRHCKSCNQEVYDFSSASNQEILEFLSNRKYN